MTVHPGQVLREEMAARGLSANRLALALRVPSGRITQILSGTRAITPDTALRLSCFFDRPAAFWVAAQAAHDLALADVANGARIRAEVLALPAAGEDRGHAEPGPAEGATRLTPAEAGPAAGPAGPTSGEPGATPGDAGPATGEVEPNPA